MSKGEAWMTENLPRRMNRFTVDENKCWNWIGSCDSGGYGLIGLAGKLYHVHRLVAAIYLGADLENDEVIRHTCNNRRCMNPAHLKAGTQQENVHDAIQDGRFRGWGYR